MGKILMASPLFIVREECARDLKGVLTKIQAIGFDGVEFLGLFGHKAREIRLWMDELGIKALGDHVSFEEFCAHTQRTLEDHAQMGCNYITLSAIPNQGLPGGALFSDTCEAVIRLSEAAKGYGITLLYHNHGFELANHVDDVEQLEVILESIPPEQLMFEPDLGWIALGGGNPGHYLTKYRERCPVIHIKDFYIYPDGEPGSLLQKDAAGKARYEFRPVGYGAINLPTLLPLCLACHPKWLVMDHDLAYARDSFQDLAWSLQYTRTLLSIIG